MGGGSALVGAFQGVGHGRGGQGGKVRGIECMTLRLRSMVAGASGAQEAEEMILALYGRA